MNIELIANIARAAARGEAIKVAFDWDNIGGSISKGWDDIGGSISKGWGGLSDEQKHAIIGGVGGLGIGALGGGLLGGGRGALIGALAGGGIGALGGRTYDPLLNYFNTLTGKKKEESQGARDTFKKDKKTSSPEWQGPDTAVKSEYQDPWTPPETGGYW